MHFSLLIVAAAILYILDIFFLLWMSGKFVGIEPLPKKDLAALGVAIVLWSWLIGSAAYHVPLIIKPVMILLWIVFLLYFFVAILETHVTKAIAAALFFLLCQAILVIVLLRQFWSPALMQFIRYILFDSI